MPSANIAKLVRDVEAVALICKRDMRTIREVWSLPGAAWRGRGN
jgi:hypothetical protein